MAAVGCLDLRERLEDPLEIFLGHADARIDHVELQQGRPLSLGEPHHEANTAGLRELDGIADEVHEDLAQPR